MTVQYSKTSQVPRSTPTAKPKKEMPSPRLFMVVFSPPKVGKTRFCGTALLDSRLRPALMVDFEGGTSVIQSKTRIISLDEVGRPHADQETKMDVFRVSQWSDINPLLDAIARRDLYQFVCVDSLTELSYLGLQARTADRNTGYPDLRSYSELTVDMRGFARAFRDYVKAHVVFTAQAKDRERREGGTDIVVPAMAGNEVTRDITGIVDLLGYLERKKTSLDKTTTTLYFEPRGSVLAGARVEDTEFPTKFEDPTVGAILTALEGRKDSR